LSVIVGFIQERSSIERFANISAIRTSRDHAAPYGVECRLIQDIHSIFVSNYFTMQSNNCVTLGGRFETPQISDKSLRLGNRSPGLQFSLK